MFNAPNPDDYIVAAAFRWQGIMYQEDSALPKGMNSAAINRFLHRNPPIIKLKAKASSSNGTSRKKKAKKSKKKATKRVSRVVAR